MRLARLLMLLLIPASLAAGPIQAAEEETPAWTQWRGPDRDGSAPGPVWPDALAGLERVWRIELGKGYPGPIIATDRVFVVETVDRGTVGVRALRRATGAELWNVRWPAGGKVPFFAARNGDWVRSTPAFDGETLYVGDMEETLRALDATTGETRWIVDFPARFDTDVPDFGFASSPLMDGEHLYVQAANSLVKLDARTGETVWRSLQTPGQIQSSGAFSSPVMATIEGVRQLVVLTRRALYGVDLQDGAVLWSREVPSFRGMHIQTPVVHGDAVFTSPYRERSYLFTIRRDEDGFEVAERWTNPATGYMSTPVVIDGHAYMHLGNQRLDCIDLASGESRWRSEPFGKYWSMVHRGGKILALDENGSLHLIRASPHRFELLDSREVSDQQAWGHLAVSGDAIFIRELEAISAWRLGPIPARPPAAGASADRSSR